MNLAVLPKPAFLVRMVIGEHMPLKCCNLYLTRSVCMLTLVMHCNSLHCIANTYLMLTNARHYSELFYVY